MKLPYCHVCGSNHKPESGHDRRAYQERTESPELTEWVKWVSVMRRQYDAVDAVAKRTIP